MSNQAVANLVISMQADGVSTTFSFDLAKDLYSLTSGSGDGSELDQVGEQINWFTNTPQARIPTGTITPLSAYGISYIVALSGTIVTLTFASAPPAAGYSIPVYLLY